MTECDVEDVRLEPVPLPEPRELTAKERAIVDFLLAGALGREALRAQAKTAKVEALCSCGCPSVYLAVDETLPPATFQPEEVPFGRTEAFTIWAQQVKAHRWTDVELHVCNGYLVELEIWAGKYGVRPRVDPAKLEYVDWDDDEDEAASEPALEDA